MTEPGSPDPIRPTVDMDLSELRPEIRPTPRPPLTERLRKGFRAAINSRLEGFATSDIVPATAHEETYLRGARMHIIQTPDPFTGEMVTKTVERRPIFPRAGHRETELIEREGGEHEPNRHHPMFVGLNNAIATGDFRGALRSHEQIINLLRNAVDTQVSRTRRIANHMAPDQHKRENFVPHMHSELDHAVYKEVMSVPNMMPVTGPGGEVQFVEDTRDWSAVLDLFNIQALRTDLMSKWQANATTRQQAHAQLEAGGPFFLDGLTVANYLGVSFKDLGAQIKGGPVVVPPQILAKLNFFLAYADDTTPPSGLSPRLAELNNQRGSDQTPLDRIRNVEIVVHGPRWTETSPGVFEDLEAMGRIRAAKAARLAAEAATAADTAAAAAEAEALSQKYLNDEPLGKIDGQIKENIDSYIASMLLRDDLTDDEALDAQSGYERQKAIIRAQTVHALLEADYPTGIPAGLEEKILDALRRRAEGERPGRPDRDPSGSRPGRTRPEAKPLSAEEEPYFDPGELAKLYTRANAAITRAAHEAKGSDPERPAKLREDIFRELSDRIGQEEARRYLIARGVKDPTDDLVDRINRASRRYKPAEPSTAAA